MGSSNYSIRILFAAVALTVFAAGGLAYAAGNGFTLGIKAGAMSNSDARAAIGAAVIAHASCTLNASQSMLAYISTNIPALQAKASSDETGIAALRTQLDSYAGNQNESAVEVFVHNELRLQLATYSQGLRIQERGAGLNQSSVRAIILTGYNVTEPGYANCTLTAAKDYAYAKADYYNNTINSYLNATARLNSTTGVNVSALDAILTGAKTQIIAPLDSGISAATTTKEVVAAVQGYCLYDGCITGTNYHLDAKIDVERLSLIDAKAKTYSNGTLNQTDVLQASSDINNASQVLSAVGAKAYSPVDKAQLWSNLTAASALLRASVK